MSKEIKSRGSLASIVSKNKKVDDSNHVQSRGSLGDIARKNKLKSKKSKSVTRSGLISTFAPNCLYFNKELEKGFNDSFKVEAEGGKSSWYRYNNSERCWNSINEVIDVGSLLSLGYQSYTPEKMERALEYEDELWKNYDRKQMVRLMNDSSKAFDKVRKEIRKFYNGESNE